MKFTDEFYQIREECIMKDFKNNKDSFTKKAGDKLERAGEKISHAGAKKIGDAVYNAGDKLEHMNDKNEKFPKTKR